MGLRRWFSSNCICCSCRRIGFWSQHRWNLILIRMININDIYSSRDVVGPGEKLYLWLVEVKLGSSYISMKSAQKAKIRSSKRPNCSTQEHIPKDNTSYHKNTCTSGFVTTLFIIDKKWHQSKCQSVDDEVIKTFWYICTV